MYGQPVVAAYRIIPDSGSILHILGLVCLLNAVVGQLILRYGESVCLQPSDRPMPVVPGDVRSVLLPSPFVNPSDPRGCPVYLPFLCMQNTWASNSPDNEGYSESSSCHSELAPAAGQAMIWRCQKRRLFIIIQKKMQLVQ